MLIIGIDPGLEGALVALQQGVTGDIGDRILYGTKVTPTLRGRTTREYDLNDLISSLEDWCRRIGSDRQAHAVIEHAQPFPGQGVTSTFTTGYGYGLLIGILSALKIPYTVIRPQTWQREMLRDCRKGETKLMAAKVCQQLWPGLSFSKDGKGKPHPGLCDALLIAEWGFRNLRRAEQKATG